MKTFLKTVLVMTLALATFIGGTQAWAAEKTSKTTKAKATKAPAAKAPRTAVISRDPYLGAIVIDATTGKTLFEDNANAKGYPASVLKLMDLLIILEKIEQRQLSFQDQVTVSAKASKTGGSQVWLKEKEVFTVDELLYALMVQSANDSAVALAEKVAGSTEAMVVLMNKRASELGMTSTTFHSVHGLPPSVGQTPDSTTARDFAVLCRELLKHADTLRYTSVRERVFRPEAGPAALTMRTHNHLMANVEGCDGLKTGYFTAAGFSVAATASQKGQRVIAVVLGSKDRKVRDARAAELIAKGFAALPAAPAPAPMTMVRPNPALQGMRPGTNVVNVMVPRPVTNSLTPQKIR